MRIAAHRIDPATGEPDPYGIPQIACPARGDDVNPQFTCRDCPCAERVDTQEAIDDLGQPFYMVDAVECAFEDAAKRLRARAQPFPTPLTGLVPGAGPRVELGVHCPLPALGRPAPPLSVRLEEQVWVPVTHCRLCQFFRGLAGEVSADAGDASVVCSAPEHLTQ